MSTPIQVEHIIEMRESKAAAILNDLASHATKCGFRRTLVNLGSCTALGSKR